MKAAVAAAKNKISKGEKDKRKSMSSFVANNICKCTECPNQQCKDLQEFVSKHREVLLELKKAQEGSFLPEWCYTLRLGASMRFAVTLLVPAVLALLVLKLSK